VRLEGEQAGSTRLCQGIVIGAALEDPRHLTPGTNYSIYYDEITQQIDTIAYTESGRLTEHCTVFTSLSKSTSTAYCAKEDMNRSHLGTTPRNKTTKREKYRLIPGRGKRGLTAI
jgi:hypothetical protein